MRAQLEWIFSDSNYHKDVHLQLLAEGDSFIPLHLIFSTYAQLQQLLRSPKQAHWWTRRRGTPASSAF